MHRRTLVPVLFLLATWPGGGLAAQETITVRTGTGSGWLGVSYQPQWGLENGVCTTRPRVEAVVRGSPAERAGLRAGDAIVALDGSPLPEGGLAAVASALNPGDSLRLTVRREGGTRELTAVADRRPEGPSGFVLQRTAPVAGTASGPVVIEDGDALVLEAPRVEVRTGPDRSVWLVESDGGRERLVLSGSPETELEERVEALLACADEGRQAGLRWEAVAPDGSVRIDIREVQARADSLRVVMAQRVLERGETEEIRVLIPGGEPGSVQAEGFRFIPGEGTVTFRVGEQMALGLRGVAGAELTAMEPTLAAYFRNADDGLLVLRVAVNTPMARAGVVPGDVVVSAGDRPLRSVAELRELLAGGGPLELGVVRQGRVLTLSLRQ